MDKTQPIFQPFCWINDEETTCRFSNDDISIYRDVVAGCHTIVDLLICDRMRDDCEPYEPMLGINERSFLELMVRSSLHLLQQHMDSQMGRILSRDTTSLPTTH